MKIPRFYQLEDYLQPNKVLVIYGPRQVGKTTLLHDFLHLSSLKYKLDSGDSIKAQEILSSENFERLKDYSSGYELVVIDEAQRIPRIGQGLKILIDQVPGIKVIATGSSSFELSGQIGEPLTGRKITLILLPVAQLELRAIYNPSELKEKLGEWLVFGGYPEVVAAPNKNEKTRILEEIVSSYLLKDILELENVKSSKILLDLLRLLAFQVGQEVSLSELSGQLCINYKTVARYLDLLEKSFVVLQARCFSRNLRQEINKKSRYYFYDLGVRNAVIANFNDLNLRNDLGQLWENFIFMERLKKRAYQNISANVYFWRTWNQKEIDLIEEREGKLFGYEIKWKEKKIIPPNLWQKTYSEAEYQVITSENYLDFII